MVQIFPPVEKKQNSAQKSNVRNADAATTKETQYKGMKVDSAKYIEMKTRLIDIAKSVGCDTHSSQMVNFFSDDDNWKGIIDAYDKEGGYPPENRPAVRKGFLKGWINYCDWADIYRFYCYAKISNDYPKLEANKNNCSKLKSALLSIGTEKPNAILDDSYMIQAYTEKEREYNGLYAQMGCDQWLIDEEKIKAEELAKRLEDEAQKQFEVAYDKTTGGDSGGDAGSTPKKNYLLYGFVGVAALLFIGIVIKKMKS